MGSFSLWHWLVVLIVILIIFGAGKLPNVMGDVAKGIKNFKREIGKDEEREAAAPPAVPPHPATSSEATTDTRPPGSGTI